MPTDKCIRLYDDQSVSPIKPSSPEEQSNSGGVSQALGPDIPLSVERQLFPEEKVLSHQGGSGAEADFYTSKHLNEEAQGCGDKVVKEEG